MGSSPALGCPWTACGLFLNIFYLYYMRPKKDDDPTGSEKALDPTVSWQVPTFGVWVRHRHYLLAKSLLPPLCSSLLSQRGSHGVTLTAGFCYKWVTSIFSGWKLWGRQVGGGGISDHCIWRNGWVCQIFPWLLGLVRTFCEFFHFCKEQKLPTLEKQP